MKKTCVLLLAMALLFAPLNILPVHADPLSGDFYYIDNADTTSVTITGITESAQREHVVIPQTINGKRVTAIGDGAFQSKSIQSLELPDGLVSLGTKAFYNNLLTSLEIPESVREIDEEAFGNNHLTSLTINDGVEKIGRSAFLNNKLTSLILPDSVTELQESAFYANRIESLVLSNNITEIGDYSFYNNRLAAINIPASVRTIGTSAFSGNRILELIIPSTVTTLKDSAFYYNALTSVTFLGTPAIASNNVFANQYLNGANGELHHWYIDTAYTQVWNNTVTSPMTIYAAWKANMITFNTNGGSTVNIQTINFGEKGTAVTSNKTEHNFAGWYKEADLINQWNFNTDIVTKNITLYAKWIVNTYTVSFNLNSGTGVAPSQTIAYNGKVASPASPSRAGYTFAGWYKNLGSTTPWDFGTDLVKTNMTLYAKWIAGTYTVNFQTNGGTAVAAQTITYNDNVVLPADPSKPGHTFAGWYTDSDLTTAWNFGTDQVTGNMTLYAKWTANTYTVSFQSNGGTAVAAQMIEYDDKVVSPANPSKAEHTFAGWYTNANLTAAWDFMTGLVKDNMTLYAKWTINTYTVNFQTNGGTAVAAQTIAYDEKVVLPANPGKAGHTFAGWYADSNLTTDWNFGTDQVAGNMTLYAKWTVNTYTVSFQTNGGTAVAAQTIAYDEKVVLPSNPVKAGHTFAGWYMDTNLTAAWNFSTDLVKGNMTLYAKWTINTYRVNFQTNGGTAVAAQTIAYDEKVVLPSNPVKAGHTFAGWYADSNLTTAWNFGTDQVAGNMTLYAKWTVNTYTVSFQSNGGTAVAAQSIAYDDNIVSPSNPVKAGHTFAGWYTDVHLATAWSFSTDLVKGNMTLYAKWTINTYTVSFQSNGGATVAAQTIAYDEKVVLPSNPVKAGHTFAGWYTDSDLATAWDFGTDSVTENMTLYAKWTVNTYEVSFQSNGGTAVAVQNIAYDEKVVAPAAPGKAGHTFAGWYTDTNLTAAWNFTTGLVKGSMTLYARWTVNTYTVSFESNGGTAVTAQNIAYDDKAISPAAPGKAGHTFAGWYTDENLTTAWSFEAGLVKGDMMLYAKWTVNTYTVSFESNGGSNVTEQVIAYDNKVVMPAHPSKIEHAFTGWYTNSNLTIAWNFGTDLVKGNMTLYARWTINTYTVSFQSNGGTAVAEQVIAYDDQAVLPAPPTKAGHLFTGWYKDEQLTTVWVFATDVVAGNTTLYAGWDKESYNVSFETSGGSEVAEQQITFEEHAVKPVDPEKSGYTFSGWFKDAELKLPWNFAADIVTGDMTLYAKWTAIASEPAPQPVPTVEPKPEPELEPEEEPEQKICSTKFTDISGHWAESSIKDIASRCIIIGFPDSEFKPNAPLIRAHVAVMFARVLELSPISSPNGAAHSFYDVSSNSSYYEAIMKVAQAGIFEGANGYFYPEQQLTRAQMAKILVLAFNLPAGGKSTFQDVPETHWASSYIAALESYGLASGENGFYKPEEPVTRAQFVAFMYRALHL